MINPLGIPCFISVQFLVNLQYDQKTQEESATLLVQLLLGL